MPTPPYLSKIGNPEKWPPRLYRFQTAEFAASLRQHGSIRVGTLHDFRNSERHGHGVLDQGEGTLRISEQIEGRSRVDQLTESSRVLFGGLPPNSRIGNLSVIVPTSMADCFIYCMSLSPDWGADIDPQYSACIEIYDVPNFFAGIARFLLRRSLITGFMVAGSVAYEAREHIVQNVEGKSNGGPPPLAALLKPAKFSAQREFRLAFEPSAVPIEPQIGSNPELAKCCRLHSPRPD